MRAFRCSFVATVFAAAAASAAKSSTRFCRSNRRLLLFIAVGCTRLAISELSAAELRLPALFSDHMVVQARVPARVWGWAAAGQTISVEFARRQEIVAAAAHTKADDAGRWQVEVPALPADFAGRLLVRTGSGETKVVDDVIAGEVWLGSGQSNMNFKIASSGVTPATIAEARSQAENAKPGIRYFYVTSSGADLPQDDVKGMWEIVSAENVSRCSAVAWYFGYALQQRLKCPVGLIVSAVGGTPVQAWMPRTALDSTSVATAVWQRHAKALEGYTPEKEQQFIRDTETWEKASKATRGARPKVVYTPTYRNVPCRLYNGMVAGLGAYPLQGIIWYQADGNLGQPEEYGELIQTMIKAWRRQWGAEVPFYYVEMNDMHEPPTGPVDEKREAMAVLREQQALALRLPKTGVVAAIDLGRVNNPTFNPHFPLKKPLGDRLANQVLTEVYGASLGEVLSPEFEAYSVAGDEVRLRFRHARGLRATGGSVKGFTLQKPDGAWVWAEGRIEGDDVVVWSRDVPRPREVRYAWASNPVISIANGAGLPLRPFRIAIPEYKPGVLERN